MPHAGKLAGMLPLLLALLLVYLLSSLVCFAAYARDKAAARRKAARTPERTLLLLGLLCGWPGGLLAQRRLRHKSAKLAFQVRFWLSVAANLGMLALLAWALRSLSLLS